MPPMNARLATLHQRRLTRSDSTYQSKPRGPRIAQPHVLRTLQALIRQHRTSSPHLTQAAIFRTLAPPAVFLFLFALSALATRTPLLRTKLLRAMDAASDGGGRVVAMECVAGVGLGVLTVLGIVRVAVWLGAKALDAFCGMDLEGWEIRDGEDDTEHQKLSQAKILGGVFL